jgi:hypothetical protein
MEKNNFEKFIIAIFSLILVCFIPFSKSCFINSINHVNVESNEAAKKIHFKTTELRQPIFLEGGIIDFSIYFENNSVASDDGYLSINLIQSGKKFESKIPVSEIRNGFTRIKAPFLKFDSGKADLIIKGVNLSSSDDVACVLSNDKVSGLSGCWKNNEKYDTPILINYKVIRFDSYFYYDVFFAFLLFSTLVFISYLLTYKTNYVSAKNHLFYMSVFTILIYVLSTNPLAGFMNDPQSEAVYEFWYKAHTMGFFKNLMSLMSGESLVWTERILMYIADKVTDGGRFVFSLAQMFELFLICSVASMFCLKTFEKYFSSEIRLLFSVLVGGNLLFHEAYYFWSVSYWVVLFFSFMFFFKLEDLKKIKYLLLLIVTIIFAVSRIYHIVFIPIIIYIYVLLHKNISKRRKIFCIVVGLASLFEVVYSLSKGGSNHISHGVIDLYRVIENTLYYQVQVLQGFLLPQNVKHSYFGNYFFLIVILLLLCQCFYYMYKRKYVYAAIIGSLGMLSFSTIMINVVVNMMSSTVGFPHNYGAKVNWLTNYYQQADLHFSYAYFAIAMLFVFYLYLLKKPLSKNVKFYNAIVLATLVWININASIINVKNNFPIKIIPTDWQKEYVVTRNKSFYLPVNAAGGAAHISLEYNSKNYIYGIYDEKEKYTKQDVQLWKVGSKLYNADTYYNKATIGDVSDIENHGILSICARRASGNFATKYLIVLKDRTNNILIKREQLTDCRRLWMDFQFEKPIFGVYKISFEDENGNQLYIRDGLQVGYSLI